MIYLQTVCENLRESASQKICQSIRAITSNLMRRLARVQKGGYLGDRGGLVGVAVKAQGWWNERTHRAKAALVVS